MRLSDSLSGILSAEVMKLVSWIIECVKGWGRWNPPHVYAREFRLMWAAILCGFALILPAFISVLIRIPFYLSLPGGVLLFLGLGGLNTAFWRSGR
jgi:hypothetical protein